MTAPAARPAHAWIPAGGDADRIRTRLIDRVARASDASHYLLTPEAVVVARDAAHVGALMRACAVHGMPLTFRSGGTSLSGQAVTSGVLVDTRTGFRRVDVLDDGHRVRAQPGATVAAVNARLAPHGRKFGPDPASEAACTVGGVVANNSSGMACGTEFNAYRTLVSVVAVLPSGTVLDTAAADADALLRHQEPQLYAGLLRLRDRVLANPDSVRRIEHLFSMKNTMGYGINAFLDAQQPVDLLTRLLVGSEGTLAFVAEAVFDTVPVRPHAATGLIVFDSLTAATDALPALVASGAATLELLDARSLHVGAADPAAPPMLRDLRVDRHCALLVEYQELHPSALLERMSVAQPVLDALDGRSGPATLGTEPASRAALWHIRKGLYAAVAGARSPGTTALLEDIVVPVPRLSHTCTELTRLFTEHAYDDAVIFGHARDGNIHFMLNADFADAAGHDRYAAFTDALVELVLDQQGSLKAEHGTGRIMAGHVRRQYGDELFAVMRDVKHLFDPGGVLNPGVVLSDDPRAYLRDLKPVTRTDAEVDRCVECGFCEPVCPSRDLTLTPRQRIVVRRAITAAEDAHDAARAAQLRADFRYDGMQTCAVDGMCATACPVHIDTGSLIRRLRGEAHGPFTQRAGAVAAHHWSAVTRVAAAGLDVANALPRLAHATTRLLRTVLGAQTVPQYHPALPGGGQRRTTDDTAAQPAAVLFAACTGALFGAEQGGSGSTAALRALCTKAGLRLADPPEMTRMCCGTPWSSKGLTAGHHRMSALVRANFAGIDRSVPVVCDASSCTEGLRRLLVDDGRVVLDAVTFVHDSVLPNLVIHRRWESVGLHPTCASTRSGENAALIGLATQIAHRVVVPASWSCCGFAGDRGLLHPELTASATAAAAAEIRDAAPAALASCNRTCELGMTQAVGQPYRHVLELLDDASTPGPPLPRLDWPG